MSRIIDPFDELAQLFLTDGEDNEPSAQDDGDDDGALTNGVVPIELLLVGHLPVRADLWLRPYAEAMARDVGTAALVRLDSDEPSVEVLGENAGTFREDHDRSLQQTLEEIASIVRLWIVRPGGAATAVDIVQAGGSRITIISSADEAALVAAYQRIKDLVDAARDADCELPAIGIAILGSAENVARSMVDRLNRTTRTFLGMELPLVATLRQMEAGSRSQAYARFLGERSPGVEDVVAWLEDASAEPAEMLPVMEARQPVREEAPVREETPPREETTFKIRQMIEETHELEESDEHEEAPPAPAARPFAKPVAAEAPEAVPGDRDVLEFLRHTHTEQSQPAQRVAQERISAPAATRPVKLAPKPVLLHEPKMEAQATEPSDHGSAQALADFVAGLSAIQVRCPGHERVELALDDKGRFHLLCKEDAMRELHLVEAWTRSHRELLAMALPTYSLDMSAKPVLHVITEKPVTLADLHGSALNLHVLAPVVVEGKTGWYAAPLNAPAHS